VNPHANPRIGNRLTQKQAVYNVLVRAGGDWVPMPEIVTAMGPNTFIASHTRIISYVREMIRPRGMDVECKEEWENGQMRPKYRLVMPVGQLRML
jgi:hypothetical protein